MTAFYTVLEICALLAVIVLPLAGPKRKKSAVAREMSSLHVNEHGYLEYFTDPNKDHRLPVN